MKNVWILNHYATYPGGVGSSRHYHLAKGLKNFGWNATIIAASVEHQTGIQRLNFDEDKRIDDVDGVCFLWLKTPTYKGNGTGRLKNILAYTWAALQSKTTRGLSNPDVIVGSSVHPFAAVAGAILARRLSIPFIFEVRDLWPQTLVDLGRLSNKSFVTWFLRQIERWLYRRAARIIVLLPLAWEYIKIFGIPKDRVVWIPNGVDLTNFPRTLISKDDGDNRFTLMYFGAHGIANGLENLLDAMKIVQDQVGVPDIRLRMIGDGPLKSSLMMKADALGLTNIFFEPPVSQNKIPELASQADAFVITVLNLPGLYRYGISMNKLFDYLAAEKPIVIASDAVNNPVRDAHAGFTVAPGDPAALARAIVQIAKTSLNERISMGRAGREYVELNHRYDHLAERFAQTINSVCCDDLNINNSL